jgi:hypothetical protein
MKCNNCFLHKNSEKCQVFCDTRAKIAVKEKKSQWTFYNDKKKCVCLIRIDECVITGSETKKCDYLFLVCGDTEKIAFFVELKGSNLEHACEQIYSTIKKLKEHLGPFCLYARIAVTRFPNVLSGNAINNRKKEIIRLLKKPIIRLLKKPECNKEPFIYQNSNTSEKV